MKTKVIEREVDLIEHHELLKKVFKNHLYLYNIAIKMLEDNPTLSLLELQEKVKAYVNDNNVFPVIFESLSYEIYYMYRKYQKNIRNQKLFNDIQYLTFKFCNPKKKKLLVYLAPGERMVIRLASLLTEDEIEELKTDKNKFINISYSPQLNVYMMNIFEIEN